MIFPFQVPHRISTTLPPSCFSCVRPLEVTVPEALKKAAAALLVVPTFNSLLHTRLPLSQTLAEIALQLPDDAVINIPADDKNAMVKVVNNNGSWKRQDNGEDVSNIPFSGVFSIYYESSKTPSYITVSSKHQTNK